MKSRNPLFLLQIAFGVMLLGVFLGWLVFVLELVQRDAEVAEARVREAEERFLQELAEDFVENHLPGGAPPTLEFVKLAAEGDRFAGIWLPSWSPEQGEPEWHARTAPGYPEVSSSSDLMKHRSDLVWGNIVDGRDRVGSIILRIARQEGDAFEAVEMLAEGVWNYGPGFKEMSPGFRLLLIGELEKHAPSDKLERLKTAEKIRAVEGRIAEIPLELEEVECHGGRFFYRRDQLPFQFGSDQVELTSSPPPDKTSVRVAGLKVWPFLSLKDGQAVEGETVAKSERAVYFVGVATLLSTVGLVTVAIWMGRRQLLRARARTDLAASVAHELRTPLAGQRVVLESMLEKQKFDESYLRMALRENKRLGNLSEEFLTFSRLERGVLDLQLEPLDLSGEVRDAVARFSSQFDDADFVVSRECPDKVMADAAAIATILGNLLENAWKYSEPPRRIEVTLFENEEEAGFEVKDNGIGLSAGDQRKIFRQFFRVEKALSRSQDGLGIGLSIARRLVEAMNGRIEVSSEKGKGSSFRVSLEKGEMP